MKAHKPARAFSVAKDGFYGLYYEPETNCFPGKGMVVCTGSDGSFALCKKGVEYFINAGMPVIALGYFNVEGTPSDPLECPVEYMQRACQWLKKEKGLHPGVWGISLGGEYVLLCGSLFPEIECVVAASPVHVITQCGSFIGGLHFCMGSPFSRHGKALPYAVGAETKEEAQRIVRQMKRNFLKQREPDMLFYYQKLLGSPYPEEAGIAVENISGPVLLISGGEDVMVPANWCCEQAEQRILSHDPNHIVVHKNYPVLSHYAFPLHLRTSSMFRVERLHRRECNQSREQEWKDTLEFLRSIWQV